MSASTAAMTATARPWPAALVLVGGLTALRLALLPGLQHGLFGDEAQYWTYAVEPAFGYYSKPPLLPWLIGLATWVFGASDWAVRLVAPLGHAAAALFVFALARRLYEGRTALWSAALYATLPGVSFSATIASTDVPLLACWSAALLALARLPDSRGPGWTLALGAAVGLGLLAKYAMGYLLLGLAVYAAVDPAGRAWLRDRRLWAGLGLGLLIWAPNLAWALAHGGATLVHVIENANPDAPPWQPWAGLGFLGAQLGVAGPLVAVALAARLALLPWRPADARERFLLAVSAPVVAVIAVQAFRAGANANWAAVAYPAATILAVAWTRRATAAAGRRLLGAALAVHLVAQAALAGLGLLPPGARPSVVQPLFDEISGWRAFTAEVTRRAEAAGADTVLVDHRYPFAQLWFYSESRLRPPRLRMRLWRDVSNHYELRYPYRPLPGETVLYVTGRATPTMPEGTVRRRETVVTRAPPGASARDYRLLVLSAEGEV